MHVCKIWDNDLTEYRFDIGLQNFKKPLDIFLPQIEGKRSKEYFIIILAVKERFDLFFLPRVHLWKLQTPRTGLKHKLKDSGFLETKKILVFVSENCCLHVYVSPNYISFIDC